MSRRQWLPWQHVQRCPATSSFSTWKGSGLRDVEWGGKSLPSTLVSNKAAAWCLSPSPFTRVTVEATHRESGKCVPILQIRKQAGVTCQASQWQDWYLKTALQISKPVPSNSCPAWGTDPEGLRNSRISLGDWDSGLGGHVH